MEVTDEVDAPIDLFSVKYSLVLVEWNCKVYPRAGHLL